MAHTKKPQASGGRSHWGRWDYLRLVLDQADDTVFGRRGLRIADPHSMLKRAARRFDGLQMQIGCHIHATSAPGPLCIVQVHMALRVTDNHVILARVWDRRINIIRHIQFSSAAQSYETAKCSTK